MKIFKSRFPKLSSATNEFGQYIKAQPKYAIAAGKKKGLSNVSSSLITKLPPSKIIPEREPLGELIAKAKSKSLRTESYALDKIRNTYGVENDPTKMSYISVNQERIDKIANKIFNWKSNRLQKIDIAAEKRIDKIIDVGVNDAVHMANMLAKKEGVFCGFTAAAAYIGALEVAKECKNAVIVFIVCDRGDRYLSTNLLKK